MFTTMFPSLIVFILLPVLSLAQNIQQFRDCTSKFYTCGQTIQNIGYPFWGNDRPSYCGLDGFKLTCREDNITTLQLVNITFRVLRISDQNNTRVTLAIDDLWKEQPDACSLRRNESMNVTTFQYTLFSYIPEGSVFLGLYLSCPEDEGRSIPIKNRLNCSGDGGDENGRVSFFEDRLPFGNRRCERELGMPVLREAYDAFNQSETMPFVEVLMQGFEMEYGVDGGGICSRCQNSGGTCWSLNSSAPSCICSDGKSRLVCPSSEHKLGTHRPPSLPHHPLSSTTKMLIPKTRPPQIGSPSLREKIPTRSVAKQPLNRPKSIIRRKKRYIK